MDLHDAPATDEPNSPKHIVIAGGTGFLGEALLHHFSRPGVQITVLTRNPRPAHANVRYHVWNATTPHGLPDVLEGQDLLINLVGRTVNCRYNARNRREILESRVQSTQALAQALAQCTNPPLVWLNAASATIYRHAEDHPQDEDTGELGSGFSVAVCRAWEEAFFAGDLPHTRRVALRIAIGIAHPKAFRNNHVMKPLSRLAKWGLGGPQGDGRQRFSWIHAYDFCHAVEFLYATQHIHGPVNLAAPNPLPNREAMQAVRAQFGWGPGLPTPVWMLKLGAWLIGTETELVLKSRWVVPTRLLSEGFRFRYPTFAEALASTWGPGTA
jgi:uncharacterized protein (TIGR01777 family)